MTIKAKLFLIAGIIALSMLLSIFSMNWSISILNTLADTQTLNHQLTSDMLMLRRNEKDFLLRNNLKYLNKFKKNYALMQNHIQQLGQLLTENNIQIENFKALSKIIENYQSQFHKLVEISQKIGLDHKSGFRGILRNSVHRAEDTFKDINNFILYTDMLMLRRNEKDFIIRKDKKYLDKFTKNYQVLINDLEQTDLDDPLKQKTLNNLEKYKSNFLNLVSAMEQKGLDPESGILGNMRTTIHKSETLLTTFNHSIHDAILKTENKIQVSNIIATLIIAILVIGLTLYLSRTITQSLNNFIRTLQNLYETGNLTLRAETSGKDEIAQVGNMLNKMMSQFQSIIQQLHTASSELHQTSQQFMTLREDTFKSVGNQQVETEKVSQSITDMSISAKRIAENTTLTAEAAKEGNKVSNEGKLIVDHTIKSSQDLEAIINDASNVIQQLGEDSNSIGSILDVIRGIAEQTNLLALNAAIEAARAGEQGRGFAVVADEVRTLAQKTQDSISEIESMISILQSGSDNAIEAISRGKTSVDNNVEQINKAGETLNLIVSELDIIANMSLENASATDEQSIQAEEVNKNVTTIKTLGKEILNNIEQLKTASDQMNTLSHNMEGIVKNFSV